MERFFNSGIIDEIVEDLASDGIYRNDSNYKKRNIEIFKSYYAHGCNEMTYTEVAEKYNLSLERVRQIIISIQKKLRRPMYCRRFRELMELL